MEPYAIEQRPGVFRKIDTPLREAVYDVARSPKRLGDASGLTTGGIHYLLQQDLKAARLDGGRIRSLHDVELAEKIAKATKELGREVPALELLGLVPWRGPERHEGNGGGRRKGRAPRARLLVPSPRSTAHASASASASIRRRHRSADPPSECPRPESNWDVGSERKAA